MESKYESREDNFKTKKKYRIVESRIKLIIQFHNISLITNNPEPQSKESERGQKMELLISEIYEYIDQEFQKLNISLKTLNSLLKFFDELQPNCDYISIFSTDIVVIYLFKKFYESGKFSRLFRNLVSIKKKIFILKLDDFYVDKTLYENISNEIFGGLYDLHKHKQDDYIGYEMHKFLSDLVANDIWQINDVGRFYIQPKRILKSIFLIFI